MIPNVHAKYKAVCQTNYAACGQSPREQHMGSLNGIHLRAYCWTSTYIDPRSVILNSPARQWQRPYVKRSRGIAKSLSTPKIRPAVGISRRCSPELVFQSSIGRGLLKRKHKFRPGFLMFWNGN